jgi:glucose/arabinose dehydrogenase
MKHRRWIVIALLIVVATPFLLAAALVVSGRVAVSDVRPIVNRLLGRSAGVPPLSALHVPAGFRLDVYADNLPVARFLHMTAAGDLLVSLPRSDQIVLLRRDANGDGKPDGRHVLLQDLDLPHGVDVHDGWLYVGESKSIGRVRFDEASGELRGKYERVVTGLTGNGNHWTKTVRIGPDNKLYVAQGSTCNVCIEKDSRRATLMRFELDGSGGEIFASGLRNSVGMDWSPMDGSLYATENGRDLLGDDTPPEELNRIERGKFYGWPYVHGSGVVDPEFGRGNEDKIRSSVAPAYGLRAHNAPLGMRFLRHQNASGYQHAALVALHGSWNRSKPDGYKVVALRWNASGKIEESDFLTGFLTANGAIGRPVDVTEGRDGAIYVSDDFAGAVYRIVYSGSSTQ